MKRRQVYTVQEIAEITGMSEEVIRRKCRNNELPAVGGGNIPYRVSRPDLNEWWNELGGNKLFEDVHEYD